jgi:hypothetical protein
LIRALLCMIVCGAQLGAQKIPVSVASAADVAIAAGRLDDAEQLLFAASSRATHEPSARGALGIYLASRGKLRIGAVLLEEARQFGGDAQAIEARLAKIYLWLGDWTSIAALKHFAASGPEHDRAKWLAAGHAPAHNSKDSVTVALEPNDLTGLGRITITVGRATLQADIDPNIDGLVLPSTPEVSAESQQFGMRDSATVAVVRELSIGAMHLANVHARLSPGARPAIGLDVLAPLLPTFDASSHTLTLRDRAVVVSGDAMPFLLGFPGVRIVTRAGQSPVAIENAAGRAALRGSRWTFDLKRGAIVR